MLALKIKSTKQIMNALLVSETFDSFLTEEVVITTYNTFHIDGHIVKEFYTNEEIESMDNDLPDFSSWKDIRPVCFSLIKGKKTPVNFRFILHASKELISAIAADPSCEVNENLIRSLVLNIRYENGSVSIVTGTSFTTFLMDKSVDHVWDSYLKKYLSDLQIDFEEL